MSEREVERMEAVSGEVTALIGLWKSVEKPKHVPSKNKWRVGGAPRSLCFLLGYPLGNREASRAVADR
jgi:hypothetical protein